MIDFSNVEDYKENNRIEAKKSLGGLPQSIWETYSAFANTMGGIILLGVEEHRDKSFHAIDLPDPQALIKEFWNIINSKRVSANILVESDVTVEQIDGKKIVAIRVPRASRSDKPVFIDHDPFCGTYRRSGEGDYRCTREEVNSMMRDASVETQDMRLLCSMDMTAFDLDSIVSFREKMDVNSELAHLSDTELLCKIGAAAQDECGIMHPTAAGLLMLGNTDDILREYPNFHLAYHNKATRGKLPSNASQFYGNIYSFYAFVYESISSDSFLNKNLVPQAYRSKVKSALRDALSNCLVNADYCNKYGIEIIQSPHAIMFENPGEFRVDPEKARGTGVSDPRNSGLMKMFKLINVCENSGSGLQRIFGVWQDMGWQAPRIVEKFEPERITLILDMNRAHVGRKGKREHTADTSVRTMTHKQVIVSYLTKNISANASDISRLIGVTSSQAREILSQMAEEGIIVIVGNGKSRVYKLKA